MEPRPHQANIPYTYEHYKHLPDDGRRYEIIEGDLFVTPAPTPFHQTVSRRLQYRLMALLEEQGIAYIFNAPCDIILSETNVLQPDLALVRKSRREIISGRGIEGPPDVAVEILSPSTRDRDEYLKRAVYARHGIGEYWVVDPEHGWIDLYRLVDKGYELLRRFTRADVLQTPAFTEVSIPLAPIFEPL